MSNKRIMQKNQVENKSYEYQIGGTRLAFVLRSDVKQEMLDFLECLKAAEKDVRANLEKIGHDFKGK